MMECDRCGQKFDEKDSHLICLDRCKNIYRPEDYFKEYRQWEVCPACYDMFNIFMDAWQILEKKNVS